MSFNKIFTPSNLKVLAVLFVLVGGCSSVLASTLNTAGAMDGGEEFAAFYNFFYSAATGYLGRAICILGGIVGLIMAATSGKVMMALMPAGLAVFGIFGPTIVNAVFESALI